MKNKDNLLISMVYVPERLKVREGDPTSMDVLRHFSLERKLDSIPAITVRNSNLTVESSSCRLNCRLGCKWPHDVRSH